jgi:hypothetical protein
VKNFQKRIIQNAKSEIDHFEMLASEIPNKITPNHQKNVSVKLMN